MGKYLPVFFLFCVFNSCSSEKVIKENPTFADICENTSLYEGVKISSDIKIIGWSSKNCKFHINALSSAINRSDWIVEENGYSLYVTGGQPKEINLFELPKGGIQAKLTSIVRKTKDKVFLEFIELNIIK